MTNGEMVKGEQVATKSGLEGANNGLEAEDIEIWGPAYTNWHSWGPRGSALLMEKQAFFAFQFLKFYSRPATDIQKGIREWEYIKVGRYRFKEKKEKIPHTTFIFSP